MSVDTKDKHEIANAASSNSKSIHHAHDKAFKLAMTEVRVAREMIKTYLPSRVANLIDTSKLTLSNSSYIDTEFKATQSDILYKTKTKNKQNCWLYFLWEHQSSYDKHIHLRLLSYTCRIMQEHINQHGPDAKLPIVLPALVYNGIKAPYPGKCDLFDSFENPELAEELMFKP